MSETYRGVNKYVDFSTGEEHFQYTKTYKDIGIAKAQATRNRTTRIGNKWKEVPVTNSQGRTWNTREYTSYFEFVETWTERVKEWERV